MSEALTKKPMVEISDEAVEAGCKAALVAGPLSDNEITRVILPRAIRAALQAALPFLEAKIRADQREKDAPAGRGGGGESRWQR